MSSPYYVKVQHPSDGWVEDFESYAEAVQWLRSQTGDPDAVFDENGFYDEGELYYIFVKNESPNTKLWRIGVYSYPYGDQNEVASYWGTYAARNLKKAMEKFIEKQGLVPADNYEDTIDYISQSGKPYFWLFKFRGSDDFLWKVEVSYEELLENSDD